MQPLRKTMTLATSLAAAAITLAGCSSDAGGSTNSPPASSAPGSSAPTSAPPKTVDTTTTATVDAPTTATVAGRDGPSSSAKRRAGGACADRDLRITAGQISGGDEHAGTVLLFRNVSSSTCTLHGYPGLDAVNA